MLAQRMSHKPAGAKSRRTSAHGDSSVRLGVLQELGAMQPGTADINTVMQTAIDGIYRGIGMDRVIAALLSDDRKTLSARFWLGLQDDYDIEEEQKAKGKELNAIVHFEKRVA